MGALIRSATARVPMSLLLIAVTSCLGKFALRLAIVGDSNYWRSGYSFYYRMAQTLLTSGRIAFRADEAGNGGYPCFRAPGYPALIAGISKLTNDSAPAFIACEAVLSTVAVGLVFWVTRMLAGSRTALLSAGLYAFFPYSFYHDTQLQENVLYNALSLLGVAILMAGTRGRPGWLLLFLGGVATGAAVLTRMSHLVSGILLVAALFLLPAAAFRLRCARALAFAAGMALVISPWLVRNKLVSDHWALTSESGFALARAHNAHTFDYFPYRGSIDRSWGAYHEFMPADRREELASVSADEFAASAWYRGQAIEYIRQDPWRAFWNGGFKVAVNFAGLLSPQQGVIKNWTYSVSFWGMTLLAVFGLPALIRDPFAAFFASLTLAQAAVSFVFYAHTSHRSYLDSLLAVPAGIGLARLLAWMRPAAHLPTGQ